MFKTTVFTFTSKLLSASASFFLILAVSRLLGPAERGICGLYLVILAIIAGFSDMAGGGATAFLLNSYSPQKLQKMNMVWALFPSFLCPFVFFLFGKINLLACIILFAGGWFLSIWNMQQQLWLGLRRFRYFNIFQFLVPVVSLVSFFLLWFLGFHNRYIYLWALITGWLSCFLFGKLFLWRGIKEGSFPKESDGFKNIFNVGLQNQMGHLASLGYSRLIYVILPGALLGSFSNAMSLIEAVLMIPGSIGQLAYARLSSERVNENKKRIMGQAWWICLLLLVPALTVLFIIPSDFWSLLFGAGFNEVGLNLRLILPGLFFYSLFLVLTYFFSSEGLFMQNAKFQWIAFGSSLLLTVLCIIMGKYSIYTGIFILGISWTIAFISGLINFRRHFTGFSSVFKFKNLNSIFRR